MASEFLVGQVVITDPLGSGYQMTAVSENVAAEDRSYLREMPQLSEHLYLLRESRSFFSFRPLPSGAWALDHRFIHGAMRPGLNRVVVHTLVVPGELLEAVHGDAWLLIAGCRYGGQAEERHSFTELAPLVREPEVREVPDLKARIPGDPRAMRFRLIEKRCGFLKEKWGDDEALRALALVLSAVEAGRGVLLPQEPIMEQLLALAWSVLPLEDRLSAPWTTHLGPGGGAVFRLALTPRPESARYEQGNPQHWAQLDGPAPRPGGGGEALAEAVVSRFDLFPQVDAGLPGFGPSLSSSGDVIRNWVRWVLAGGDVPSRGFTAAGDLAAFLAAHIPSGEVDLRRPWLARGALLSCAALTVVRQSEATGDWRVAVRQVVEGLVARKLAWSLLEPGQIVTMIRQGTSAPEAQAALGALALFLAFPERSGHAPSLEALLEALEARSGEAGSLASLAGKETAPVFSDLALHVLQLMPGKAEAVYRIVQGNGGLAMALDRLTPPLHLGYLNPLRGFLRMAQEAGDRALAGRMAGGFLVPLLARHPSLVKVESLGKQVLEALCEAPEGLVRAFVEWKDEGLYDMAAQTLRGWAEERRAEACRVAERLVFETCEGARDLVRERPSILGMARALANAGSPAAHWLVFALAEAAVIDGTHDREGLRSFRAFLRTAKIEHASRFAEPLKMLLARFHPASSSSTTLGPAHRALVIVLAESLGRHPAETAAALRQLSELPSEELLLWGEAVYAVSEAISRNDPKAASQVARNWWTGLMVAALKIEDFPSGALNLLDLLVAPDAAVVLVCWTPRMPSLGTHRKVRLLLEAFEALAQRHCLRDLEFLCGVGRLARELRHGGRDLIEAVGETATLAARLGQSETQTATALARLLPVTPPDFAKAVLELLVSPRISPVLKSLLEERFQRKALEHVTPSALPGILPRVEVLAERQPLLLEVSRHMGRSWSTVSEEGEGFLRQLLELERYDALGVFLREAEESDRGILKRLKRKNPELYRALEEAARHPVGRWDLARFGKLQEGKVE